MKIVISVALATILFVGCTQEQSNTAKEVTEPTQTPTTVVSAVQKIDEVLQTATESADEVSQSVKELSDTTVSKTQEIVEQAKTVTNDAVKKTKEVVKEVADEVQTSAAAVSESLSQTNELGKATYKACASCHGQNGEKPALGKSQVIKGWSASKTLNALNGYKDGSYGGTMKAVMKSQASGLTEEKAKAVAEYISTL